MGLPILVRQHLYIESVPRSIEYFSCKGIKSAFSLKKVFNQILITQIHKNSTTNVNKIFNKRCTYLLRSCCTILYRSWWRHQMKTFSALLAICAGNSPVPGISPHKGQWRGALMFSLICVWINGWVNNRQAGDLRRYRVHYDVIVMIQIYD